MSDLARGAHPASGGRAEVLTPAQFPFQDAAPQSGLLYVRFHSVP